MTIADLLNLGPATEAQLARVGVTSPDELRELGALEAYVRLKIAFPDRINAVALYALEGALRGVHWNELPDEDKASLVRQADALLSAAR